MPSDSTDLMHRCQSEVRAHEKRLGKLRDEIARLTAEHDAKGEPPTGLLEATLAAVSDVEEMEKIRVLKVRAAATMDTARIWAAASVKALDAMAGWET